MSAKARREILKGVLTRQCLNFILEITEGVKAKVSLELFGEIVGTLIRLFGREVVRREFNKRIATEDQFANPLQGVEEGMCMDCKKNPAIQDCRICRKCADKYYKDLFTTAYNAIDTEDVPTTH